jgi:hypothetical protein
MNKLHTPQRLADESFEDYKARRLASAQRVALITCTLEPGGKNTSREILRANRRANRKASSTQL